MATSYHTPSDLRLILPGPNAPANGSNKDAAIRRGPTAVGPATTPETPRIAIDVEAWQLVGRRDSGVSLEGKRKSIAARIDAAAGMLKKITSRVCALPEMRESCRA